MINIINTWDELYELELDIQEWLQILEEQGRRDSKVIWSNLNTRKIIRLTEKLLQNFKICFDLVKDNKKEKKNYQMEVIKSYKTLKEIKKDLHYE